MKGLYMGWNGSDLRHRKDDGNTLKNSPDEGKRKKVRVIILPFALVAVAAVVFILFSDSDITSQSVSKSRETDTNVKGSAPKHAERKVAVVDGADSTLQGELAETNEYAVRFPGEKIIAVETNAAGYIQVEAIKKDGGKILHVVTPPPIFDHPTDELILAVLNTPDGQQMPPLPPGLSGAGADLRFRRSLKDEIVIKPEDSDKVRAYKEIVRSARAEIAERMDAGEHFSDIIAEQHKLCNENAKIKSDATRELNALIKNGDAEGARKYFLAINAAFQQMGISPLKLNDQSKNQVVQEILK